MLVSRFRNLHGSSGKFVVGLMALFSLLSRISAEEPPKPSPLPEKVAEASHIFIATASRVRIEFQDPLYSVEMTVKIDEVIFPREWHPAKSIRIRLSLDLLDDQVIELLVMFKKRKKLFLLMQPWGKSRFTAAADYNQIAVPLTEREQVEALLKSRIGNDKH